MPKTSDSRPPISGPLLTSRGRSFLNRMVKPNSSTKRSKRSRAVPKADLETRKRILDAAHSVFLRKGTASGAGERHRRCISHRLRLSAGARWTDVPCRPGGIGSGLTAGAGVRA
jgi:hypothetical protein